MHTRKILKRSFHQARPTGLKSNILQSPIGNQKFYPLPFPTGVFPYHLSLDDVLSKDQISSIQKSGEIIFHIVGDTGGIKNPVPQQIVAMAMESDFNNSNPAFFYHLGDVVYYYGESSEYYSQFYDPYVHYPAPIFAIPGNHDGDVAPGDLTTSLKAFVRNFCSSVSQTSPDAGDSPRHTMTIPNVYWTLDTPFATIIGLYSNVPEGGQFDKDQISWFTKELEDAPKNKALIVSVHHPAYSVDQYHSGSKIIEQTLDDAFKKSGRYADIVFTGHVHNYQRFTRKLGGRQIPYIVAGAGGYWHLHYMQKLPDGSPIQVPYKMTDTGVTLESYCEDRHGYMLLKVSQNIISGQYYAVSRPQESWRAPPQLIDSFELNLKTHTLAKNLVLP
ncbi:MAG TPA: metallophosphoesterase [Nitrosopumilaceae archaeon]|nr:metallophosphoesterase [Nitrosopumilaceae archaeon]